MNSLLHPDEMTVLVLPVRPSEACTDGMVPRRRERRGTAGSECTAAVNHRVTVFEDRVDGDVAHPVAGSRRWMIPSRAARVGTTPGRRRRWCLREPLVATPRAPPHPGRRRPGRPSASPSGGPPVDIVTGGRAAPPLMRATRRETSCSRQGPRLPSRSRRLPSEGTGPGLPSSRQPARSTRDLLIPVVPGVELRRVRWIPDGSCRE